MSEQVSASAQAELLKMGVNVLTEHKVTKIDDSFIYFANGQSLPATLKVWSVGIKAPDFLKNIAGLETNCINQLIVHSTLQTTLDSHIFAMGDCASYTPAGQQRAVPPRAQVANQQAIFLEQALKAHIEQAGLPEFVFKDKGSLVSLSEKTSVGSILGNINIQGFCARMMYVSLYRFHQMALHGFWKTSVFILKDRLSRSARPPLKMH